MQLQSSVGILSMAKSSNNDNCINQPSGKLIAYQLLSRSHKHESNCFLETKAMRQASHFDPPTIDSLKRE